MFARIGLLVFLAGFFLGADPVESTAQQPLFVPINPREIGLDLPAGSVTEGKNATVVTRDADGRSVVGKVWVNVGESRVVLMPDGELVARSSAEATPTEKRFVPLTTDELAKRLAEGPFRAATIKKSKHYVYVYDTSEEFWLAVSRTLESMIPGMLNHARMQRVEAHEPPVPLVAIMFQTRKQFDSFRRMPPGVLAYYHTLSNQVVMYEESPLWQSNPELALQQSISTIAHEGAHQILHNIGVQQRLSLWPMWLSEGLAEYYSPTTFGRNMKWKGPGQVNDLRMFELETYFKERSGTPRNGQLIEHTVAAAQLTSTGYAAAWSLTHLLARTQRERFHGFVRAVSKMRPLEGCGEAIAPGVIPQNLAMFREHFGEDFSALEERLIKHLKAQPYNYPFSEFPHFVVVVEVPQEKRSRREANLFHSRDLARKWATGIIAALDEPQRSLAKQSIESFPNRPAAERYMSQIQGTGK